MFSGIKAEEERKMKEIEEADVRRQELDDLASQLESQRQDLSAKRKEIDQEREELAEEWRFITQKKKKRIVHNIHKHDSKSDQGYWENLANRTLEKLDTSWQAKASNISIKMPALN